jgi:hypothetical protein
MRYGGGALGVFGNKNGLALSTVFPLCLSSLQLL